MSYLLDVNALVALGFFQHEFHTRVSAWVRGLTSKERPEFLTCSITEIGFVRVLAQAPQYGIAVSQARKLLLRLKAGTSVKFRFIPDGHDISHLPPWVQRAKQTTDGHLAALARANSALLATLDRSIPRTFLIPPVK
jgi:predicted nucleic acid-binding protein